MWSSAMGHKPNSETGEQAVARIQGERKAEAAAQEAKFAAISEELEKSQALRDAAAKKIEAERKALVTAKLNEAQGNRDADLRRQALSSWRANGGNEDDFADSWPDLKRDILAQRVAADLQSAQSKSARDTHERF